MCLIYAARQELLVAPRGISALFCRSRLCVKFAHPADTSSAGRTSRGTLIIGPQRTARIGLQHGTSRGPVSVRLFPENLRVLEVAEAMAGPYCGMLLGDFGADVIKIERPKVGDQSRNWGPPFVGTESTYFLAINRNKRSLTLNLNHPRGLEILEKLVLAADVFIINQPSYASLAKRGMHYEALSTLNPRLIYCSITGYGFTGPKVGRHGYDIIAQGEAGVMSLTGEPEGEPMRYPIAIADITCGIYATLGIFAALLAREKSGRGQFLDMALFDSQLTWLANVGSSYLNAGDIPRRLGNAHPSIVPYQLFRGRDGRYFVVGVGTERLWNRFCSLLGLDETVGRDPRFTTNRLRIQHREELISLLQEVFAARPAQEWTEEFRKAEIPAGPVNSISEALSDQQTLERGMIVQIEHPFGGVVKSIANPIKMSETPITFRLPPPVLGEHTERILRDLGLPEKEIRAAQAEGVL